MDETIIATYCLRERSFNRTKPSKRSLSQMSDAFVMTTAIVAALYFGGNYQRARPLLFEQNYIPKMLSLSRFSRRLHRIKPMFLSLFSVIRSVFKDLNSESIYVIDTIPVACCFHFRIPRAKLYGGKAYRGYQPAKKRYFYGVKIHLLITADGKLAYDVAL